MGKTKAAIQVVMVIVQAVVYHAVSRLRKMIINNCRQMQKKNLRCEFFFVFSQQNCSEMRIKMTKSYKEKVIQLGKYMNGNSKFSIPLVKCIQECFEIAASEDIVDKLLMVQNNSYS